MKMNPKHLIVLENRKKKLTQHFVYHQSNSFLKEHRMMKTSLRSTFSFQDIEDNGSIDSDSKADGKTKRSPSEVEKIIFTDNITTNYYIKNI